jgi:hypothetical protein
MTSLQTSRIKSDALSGDSLAATQKAAAFLRLKYGTLALYRCQGSDLKLIRYRMANLSEYAKGNPTPHVRASTNAACERSARS